MIFSVFLVFRNYNSIVYKRRYLKDNTENVISSQCQYNVFNYFINYLSVALDNSVNFSVTTRKNPQKSQPVQKNS